MATLTVVVPFWDLPIAYLERSLASVADQGLDVRTIVVDNASRTPVPAFAAPVEVLRLPERVTTGGARNAGLALVETSHVLFLDADDELAPGALERLLSLAKARPDAVACHGPTVHRLDPGGNEDDPVLQGRLGHRFVGNQIREFLVRRGAGPRRRTYAGVNTVLMLVGAMGAVLRTDAVRAIGGFAVDPVEEDWTLTALLPFHGPIVRDANPTYHVWVRHDGTTVGMMRNAPASGIPARRSIRVRLRNDPTVPRWMRAALPLVAVLHGMPYVRVAQRRVRGAFGSAPGVGGT